MNIHRKFAGPLPRACQIIRNVLLPSGFSICSIFFRLQSTQTPIWTRIRATSRTRTEFEQEFELELLFLFEKCAREAASLGAIRHVDSHLFSSRVSPFYEAISGKKWCQMEPQMASKNLQNLIKNQLETKSTKHVEMC